MATNPLIQRPVIVDPNLPPAGNPLAPAAINTAPVDPLARQASVTYAPVEQAHVVQVPQATFLGGHSAPAIDPVAVANAQAASQLAAYEQAAAQRAQEEAEIAAAQERMRKALEQGNPLVPQQEKDARFSGVMGGVEVNANARPADWQEGDDEVLPLPDGKSITRYELRKIQNEGDSGFVDRFTDAQGWAPTKARTLADLYSVGGMLSNVLGGKKLAEKWLDEGLRWSNEAQKYGSENDSIDNAIANGKVSGWVGNVFGQLTDSLLEIGATTAAGAALGGGAGAIGGLGVGAGPGAVGGAAGGFILGMLRTGARKLLGRSIGKAAREMYIREFAKQRAAGVSREVAMRAANSEVATSMGAATGRYTALAANSLVHGGGETVRAAREEGIDPTELEFSRFAIGAGTYAALDVYGDVGLLRAFNGTAGGIRRQALRGGAREGLTEVGQDVATSLAGAGELPTGMEAVNSFMAGFVGAGGLHGTSAAIQKIRGLQESKGAEGADKGLDNKDVGNDALRSNESNDGEADNAVAANVLAANEDSSRVPTNDTNYEPYVEPTAAQLPITKDSFPDDERAFSVFIRKVQPILSDINKKLRDADLTLLDDDGKATDTNIAVDLEGFLSTPAEIIESLQRNVSAERSAVVNSPAQDTERLAMLDAIEANISDLNMWHNYAMNAPRIKEERDKFIQTNNLDPSTPDDDLVRVARRIAKDADDATPQELSAFTWLGLQGGRDEVAQELVDKTLASLHTVKGAREFGLPSALGIDGTLVALDSIGAGLLVNGVQPTKEQRQAAGALASQLRQRAAHEVDTGGIRPSDYTHRLVTISPEVVAADHAWRETFTLPEMLRQHLADYNGENRNAFKKQVDLIEDRIESSQVAHDNGTPLQQFLGDVANLSVDVAWIDIPESLRQVAKTQIDKVSVAYANLAGGKNGLGASSLYENFDAAFPPDVAPQSTPQRGVVDEASARLTDVLRAASQTTPSTPAANPLTRQADLEVGPVGESQPGASRVPASEATTRNPLQKPTRSESKSKNSKVSHQQTRSTSTPQQNSGNRSTSSTKSSETTKPSTSPGGSWTSSDPLFASSIRVASAQQNVANNRLLRGKTAQTRTKPQGEADDEAPRPNAKDILSDTEYRDKKQKLHDPNTTPEEAVKLKEALEAHNAALDAGLDRHYVGSRKVEGNEFIVVANASPAGNYDIIEKDNYGRVTWRATAPDALAARTMLTERGYAATRATRRGDPLNPHSLSAWHRARPVTRSIVDTIRRALGVEVDDPNLRWYEDALVRFTESSGFLFSNFYNMLEGFDVALARIGSDQRVYLPFKNKLQKAHAIGLRDSHAANAYAATAMELQRIGSSEQELGRYLHALTALERHERHDGSNIVGTQAKKNDVTHFEHNGRKGIEAVRAYLNELPSARRAQLERAAKPMRDLQQYALQRAYESQLMTKQEAEQLGLIRDDGTVVEGAFKHYVPLLPPEGRSKNGRWITGRKRPENSRIANPLLMSFDASTTLLKRAEYNEALANMAAVLREYNDPREFTIDITESQPRYRPEQFFESPIREQDKVLTPEQKAALELRWFDPDMRKEHTLTFRQDGKIHGITFHSEAGKRMVKKMHTAPHTLVVMMSRVMHFLSSTITLIPSFQAKAMAWDALMVSGKMQAASGNTLDLAESRRTTAKMYRYYLESLGALGGDALRGRYTSPNHWVSFFNDSGAGVAPGSRGGFEQAAANLRRAQLSIGADDDSTFDRLRNRVVDAASRYVDTSHAAESAFRLAAFRAYIEEQAGRTFSNENDLRKWARENPAKMDIALQISRDITTDYSTHGASTWVRALYLFFNPAVRGARGMRDMFLTKQGQYLAASLAGVGVIAGLMGPACAGDDHDDRTRYLRLSQRDAQIQFCEGFGIPLSHELRLPYVAAREMVSMMTGQSKLSDSAESIFNTLVGMTSPINIEAGTSSEKATMAALPHAVQMVIAGGLGVGRFGEDLESDYNSTFGVNPETGESMKRLTHPADHMRGRPSDPMWARRLTAWLYDTSDGGIDVTPGRTTEFARFTMGGFYNALMTLDDPNKPARHLLTAGFENKYQLFELKRSFEENEAELEQRFVQYQRTGNDLRFSDEQRRDLAIIREAKKAAKQAAQIGGRSESQWYNELRMAQAAGDASREAAAYDAIEQIREIKNVYYGAALKQISRRYE